ncbi:creatininase family protein [Paenibacillus sp. FSL H8-0457]|uniref:creatininase family protein n=1 Tax=Bacillales TaxID=1385 RepID=UPI0001788DAF|nr:MULTISPECIES: creatininase family protein [Paenibacillus]ACX67051.1 Creatininase [Paenibacillus sp. Y412MC10]ETT68548.1 Creatininase [Paenibacillus sp. FSL H8-457]MCM3259518.1 creatininase family protein [Paenibacillus lautus]
MKFELENSVEVEEKIRKLGAAILPIGAVEAHGPHLPLGTDNLLASRLADKLAERTDSFVLPTLPYGQVWSLRNFPGSINVSNEALIRLLADIGESIYHQGFRIFIMVNGHLGNAVALKEAARILYERVPELKVFYFFYPGTKEITAEVREASAAHGSYMHADEIETSYMLYLAGEYVDMSKAIDGAPHIPIEADFTPTPWEEMTASAVLGDATLATREKGERIIERSLEVMADMVLRAKKAI